MNLAQLRALAAVAECGSVTDAAGVLSITQSAVSHALASLERELSAPLLSRSRSGSRLTALGEQVLPHAREALRQVELIAEEAAAAAGTRHGRLRLGVFPSAGQLLPALLGRLQDAYPGIRPVLMEGSDAEVSDWIATGVVDLGVVTGPRPDLHSARLAVDEMVAVLPDDHPLAGGDDIAIAELVDDPFILSTGGCAPLLEGLYRQQGCPLTPAHQVRDMSTLLAMVAENLGVSIVPALALHVGRPPHLVALPLRPRAPRHLLLAARTSRDLSPAARALLDYLPATATQAPTTPLSADPGLPEDGPSREPTTRHARPA